MFTSSNQIVILIYLEFWDIIRVCCIRVKKRLICVVSGDQWSQVCESCVPSVTALILLSHLNTENNQDLNRFLKLFPEKIFDVMMMGGCIHCNCDCDQQHMSSGETSQTWARMGIFWFLFCCLFLVWKSGLIGRSLLLS